MRKSTGTSQDDLEHPAGEVENRVMQALQATVLAKVKSFDPLGSLKDRIGVNRIEATTAALDATAEHDESDEVQSRAWEVPQMLRGEG